MRFNLKTRALIFSQWANLLHAGIPLTHSLELLIKTHPKKNSYILSQLKNILEKGHSIGESVKKFPQLFDPLSCHLLAIAELTGELDKALLNLGDYYEQQSHLISKIKKACFYPAILIIIAVIVSVGLLNFVMPKFIAFYTENHTPLPSITVFMMKLSYYLRTKGWILLLIHLILFLIISQYIKTQQGRLLYDFTKIQLPMIKKFTINYNQWLFSYSLHALYKGGVPLAQGLSMVETTISNHYFRSAIKEALQTLVKGQRLSEALRTQPLFPTFAIDMIYLGEESGTLEIILSKLMIFYQAELERSLTSSVQLLEPILMTMLGILIGGILIGFYLPIFQLGTNL